MRLFNDIDRSGFIWKEDHHLEQPFAILNESNDEHASAVRSELEKWFAHIIDEKYKAELHSRFREGQSSFHAGMVELLTHELCCCHGYVADYLWGKERTPDFLVKTDKEQRVFIEVTHIEPLPRVQKRLKKQMRAIETGLCGADCRDYAFYMHVWASTDTAPSIKEIQEFMTVEIDHFENAGSFKTPCVPTPESTATCRYESNGWYIEFSLLDHPWWNDSKKGLAVKWFELAEVQATQRIRNALKRKSPSKYSIDEKPFIVVADCQELGVSMKHFGAALYGNHKLSVPLETSGSASMGEQIFEGNGVWLHNRHVKNTRLSSVVALTGFNPFSLNTTKIAHFHHPCAQNPATVLFPSIPCICIDKSGKLDMNIGTCLSSVLGLPIDWPNIANRI